MKEKAKKYINTMKKNISAVLSIFITVFIIILVIISITKKIDNKSSFKKNIISQTASLFSRTNSFSIEIPPHVNLEDFYKTYGTRLLGNSDLKIISREEWGADESLSNPNFIQEYCQKHFCFPKPYDPEINFTPTNYLKSRELMINYQNNFAKYDNLFLQTKKKSNGVTYYYLPAEEIVIHHTAGKFTKTFAESKKELQRIYLLHAVQRRWRDIGYHYLIDSQGRIFEGSLGGKYSVGAHTYYHNRGTIAIALMGDFRSGHDKLTPAMINSLIKLIKYLIKEYKWDISQPLFYLRKPDLSGREWSNKIIKGHRELDWRNPPTECPGIDPAELRKLIYPKIFPKIKNKQKINNK